MILPSRHQPYWVQHALCPAYETLRGKRECDVAVIGAGITGLTAAALLKQAGKRVVVLEMNEVGAGTTGHSTGHLDAHPDVDLAQIVKKFNLDTAAKVVESRLSAINVAESLVQQHDIHCDFRRVPAYLYAENGDQMEDLEREHELAEKVGLAPRRDGGLPLPFGMTDCVRFENFARFSPFAYVCGLAGAIRDEQCQIFTGSRVEHIEQREGGGWRVMTGGGGVVLAEQVICAVHAGFLSLFSLETRVDPWQSYVVAARVNRELPDALYWDMDEPYHYTRWATTEDPTLLIIGGADHRTGETGRLQRHEAGFDVLREYVHQRWGPDVQFEGEWSHEFFSSADTLPFIGQIPGKQGVLIATGFDGDGLTYGTLAGRILCDLAAGRENEWAQVYAPSRLKPLAAGPSVLEAATRTANHWLGDRVRSGEVASIEEIPPDEGAIMRSGAEKLAVYRDADGGVHAFSAACRHAGCIVHFNSSEKTWDCPCHGGRYDRFGKVIAAPPVQDLEPRDVAELQTRTT